MFICHPLHSVLCTFLFFCFHTFSTCSYCNIANGLLWIQQICFSDLQNERENYFLQSLTFSASLSVSLSFSVEMALIYSAELGQSKYFHLCVANAAWCWNLLRYWTYMDGLRLMQSYMAYNLHTCTLHMLHKQYFKLKFQFCIELYAKWKG